MSIKSFHTNVGHDRRKVQIAEKIFERDARNAQLMAAWEGDALSGNQRPEFITPEMGGLQRRADGTVVSGRGQFTYDAAEEKGYGVDGETLRVKPKQYIIHVEDTVHVDGSITPKGTVEKEFSPAQLDAIAHGIFCVRCEDRQPADDHVRHELHVRLKDATGFVIPTGLTEKDCCCYCGGRLGFNGHLK